jgi:carboxypeptidase T
MRRLAGVCLTLVSLLLLSWAVTARAASEDRYILRVLVKDKDHEIPKLADLHLDLAGIDTKAGTADFVGDSITYVRLREAGFDPEIVWSAETFAPDALSDYMTSTEVSQKLDFYQATYPTLAKKVQIATTENGRPEWAMKISDNVNVHEDEPVVLYVAQHHAREVMTSEISIDIIDYLLTRYATDPRVRAWVDGREIWVVGTHNPDGTDYVFSNNSLWRKNRRNNGDGTFGVDPNRNYQFNWGVCNGSSGVTSDDTYRGPSPASEPETQGFMQLARDVKPALALSYHTYSELVIIPYGCTGSYSPENRMFRDLSSEVGARIPNDLGDGTYQPGTGWELLYATDGEWGDWLYSELGTAGITIEANSSTQGFSPDYATWRNTTVARNRAGWQYLLDRVDGPAITGHTTDACTAQPLSATLGLDEVVFSNGETPRVSEPTYGRFDWITSRGPWHLNVSKAGYRTQDWPVEVGSSAVKRNVRLVPSGGRALEPLSYAIQDPSGDGDGEADPGEAVTMQVTAYATGEAVSGATAVLSTADPYVTITDGSASWPSIGAGQTAAASDSFGFSVSPAAPDGHVISFALTFASGDTLCAATSSLDVRVTTGSVACPAVAQNLDTNPGWTIQNSDSLGWAFGAPGTPVPPRGGPPAPHSGSNLYGTNLNGAYGNAADYKLVTTPFNLANLRHAELKFWRWLNNESGYDIASVDVSTDGTSFTTVWSGYGYDTQWEPYSIDISSIADLQATVYVRFRLKSDSSLNLSGFYIDDVSICGETLAPAPRLAVASWTTNDAQNGACSDHDAYADPGEEILLTANVRNNGTLPATNATAVLSTTNPHIALIAFRSPLGTLAPGATAQASFRFRVADAASCLEPAAFQVRVEAGGGQYVFNDASIVVTLRGDTGTAVPNSSDGFETLTGWALTGEWQIAQPLGKGGSAGTGGAGGKDPLAAASGIKVLGIDLTGQGASFGNYENNLTAGITATSPVYDCSHAHNVQLQFKRWLGVQGNGGDHATVEVWDGGAWQQVWGNPAANLSDTSWQALSYDVSTWADGNAGFRVRFKLTSDASVVYCGWNVDDLVVTNSYVPINCEGAACAAGCTPTQEVSGVAMQKNGAATTAVWNDGADPCLGAGARYRVYRSTDPRPTTALPSQWPQQSSFLDVTIRDMDGTASNASYTDADNPAAGQVLYYLIVPMGSSGAEGPKGWQGF